MRVQSITLRRSIPEDRSCTATTMWSHRSTIRTMQHNRARTDLRDLENRPSTKLNSSFQQKGYAIAQKASQSFSCDQCPCGMMPRFRLLKGHRFARNTECPSRESHPGDQGRACEWVRCDRESVVSWNIHEEARAVRDPWVNLCYLLR